MVRLFLLGYKGLIIIRNIPDEYRNAIESVVIGKDKNVKNDFFEEIKYECIKKEFTWFEKGFENETEAEYFFMVGWRWLIKHKFGSKIIVFHDSLLPKYRGFNPLVTALINGDKKIGVTCLLGNDEFDAGDIICQKPLQIDYPIKIEDAIKKIADAYLELFVSVLQILIKGELKLIPQNSLEVSYSLWRDQDDYYINWNWDAGKIERFIDAVGYPYLGARTMCNGKTIIIRKGRAVNDVKIENRDVGKVIFKRENEFTVVCGQGLIEIGDFKTIEGNDFNELRTMFRIRFK